MIVVAVILFFGGFLMLVGGQIWLFINGIREDKRWGWTLMIPIVGLIRFFKHSPHKALPPTVVSIIGGALWGIGYLLGGDPMTWE